MELFMKLAFPKKFGTGCESRFFGMHKDNFKQKNIGAQKRGNIFL